MDFDFTSLTGASSSITGIQGIASQAGSLANASGNSNIGSTVNGLGQPLAEAATIAGAATGNPVAILKLITNPQAAIDFAKDYNPIAIAGTLDSLMSKNGVSSDFFSKYPWAAFMDNSTMHWKSRKARLNSMSPVERISWYMKNLNDGVFHNGDVAQYCYFYGHVPDGAKVSNDESQLPYQVAAAWNALVKKIFFSHGETSFDHQGYGSTANSLEDVTIDLTKTKDFDQVLVQIRAQAKDTHDRLIQQQQIQDLVTQKEEDDKLAEEKSASNKKIMIIGGVVLAVIIVVVLIIKGK